MRPLRVYLDTSVIGGVFDAEFAEDSHRLFQAVRNGRAMALISETTTGELAPAPPASSEVAAGPAEGGAP